jgi:hypothetical protein
MYLVNDLVELLKQSVAFLLKVLELLQLDLVLPLFAFVLSLKTGDCLLLRVKFLLHEDVFVFDLLELLDFCGGFI